MAMESAQDLLQLDLANSYCGLVNIREVTITELRHAFSLGLITCQQLTKCYIKRIELLNPFLHAVIELNPDAIEIAEELDQELKGGSIRSLLHGIPILLKDNIGTCDKTETCAGSAALIGLKPKEDSEVVRRLRAAGAVILGKANLSEFANFRGIGLPDGWSSRGNHTSNAYVIGANPSGSSSGSAVAVAANLAVVALGTETDGSIISPCSLASVVGLKPTVGLVPNKGVVPLSLSQDSVGPIARTVNDAAILFGVICDQKIHCPNLTHPTLHSCLEQTKFKVGVLRLPFWQQVDPTIVPELEMVVEALKRAGVSILDPVPNSESIMCTVSGDHEHTVFSHEFKSAINEYLMKEVVETNPLNPEGKECNRIHCLADIIKFNEDYPVPEGYNQIELLQAESTSGIDDRNYKRLRDENMKAARTTIDSYLLNNDLDAFVIPSDSDGKLAAVAGYPVITVPAGFHKNGIPFGISFFGTEESEDKLLQIAFLLESAFKARHTSLFLPKNH